MNFVFGNHNNPHRDRMIQHMDEVREALAPSVRRLFPRDMQVVLDHLYYLRRTPLPGHVVFIFHPVIAGSLQQVKRFASRTEAEDFAQVYREQPHVLASVEP